MGQIWATAANFSQWPASKPALGPYGKTVSYRVRIRLRGERPRTRTFKRLTDAKAWAAKAESDLGHGTYVPRACASVAPWEPKAGTPSRTLISPFTHPAINDAL
ncbi:hypothetical protein J2X04_000734 [Lysobacter niabensis]|jgi:hypothetical protein|uniref:Integrase n=1 Tax=Agrilutibacter niabensis TaxID=380628 RepID=A0ABU1VLN9_9GAMM|nr:hypothetical protein [Lysobacter niabensis]